MAMLPLPIDAQLPQIIAKVREKRRLVLVAEPGAGKTTRVPPALLKSGALNDPAHPKIVLLQPRRVAARAAAMRIADENGWRVGGEVGWHVRFDRQIGPQTRLCVLTEGILTRQLIDDPFMEGVGAVILDEFHERSIHTDLTIALLREVQQTVRHDLIVIVMSATLEAEPVANFIGSCPIINVPGRTFPIDVRHSPISTGAPLPQRVESTLSAELDRQSGDVLVFLPGVQEINRTAREISPLAQRYGLDVLPLHGSLPADEQMRALKPSPQRKIILATNIAETSLTIEGVRLVIDSGLARIAGYDAERGLDRLDLKRISKASAIQRAGRAGRTAPGTCVRLYTEKEFHAMSAFESPEIRRIDLAGTVLSLHAWGKPDPRTFGWYDPPPEATLANAEDLLEMLGAMEDGAITPLGRQMVALPVHPRLARLLIAAVEQGILEQGAAIAALLSERDIASPEHSHQTHAASDLFGRMELIKTSPQVLRLRDELLRLGKTIRAGKTHRPADVETAMLRVCLLAYPDRVCRRRSNDPSTGVMVGGGGVRLSPDSVVRQHEFFVALDARQDDRSNTREAIVRIASGIEMQWLEDFFPDQIQRGRSLIFDPQRQRVVGLGSTTYRGLILREDRDAPVDPEQAGQILADALRPTATERLARDPAAAQFLARVELLRNAMPEHPWPKIDPGDILDQMCRGKRGVEELDRVSPIPFLQSTLIYPLDRLLEEHAPTTIAVPSGNRISIQYAASQAPVLAARLQELFGWTDTPRIAAGRVPILVHILGPNFRPVQITNDLRSFWQTTYFQVKKDLKVRYPKHSWPDDPLTATATARGGRRPRP